MSSCDACAPGVLRTRRFMCCSSCSSPFIVYLVANTLGTSGIIAVVAAGILNVVSPRAMSPSISRMNIVSSSVWRVVSFALNGFVFVLLGTQLPRVMQQSWDDVSINNGVLIGYVLLIVLISYIVRFVWLCVMDRLRRPQACLRRTSAQTGAKALRSWLIMTLGGAKGHHHARRRPYHPLHHLLRRPARGRALSPA